MGEIGGGGVPGLQQSDVTALLASLGIGDVGTATLATLPDPALWPRRTIWVTDMWSDHPAGAQGGRMVSEGGFWKAIRPLVAGSAAVATMTTKPWVTPSTLILNTPSLLGLGVTMNITLGLGSGFAIPSPGYRQRITKPKGSLGTLNALVAVAASAVAITTWADYEFDGTAWQITASG